MTRRRDTLPDTRQTTGATYRLTSHSDLLRRMRRRGYTSGYALAQAAGLGQGTVNHLVHGRRTTCSERTATAIERALRLEPDELFKYEEYPVSGYPERRAS